MIELDFLRHLDRFNLIINKRITSNYTGPRKSMITGRGLIYKDYAQYTPGDDFRSIDWKVFARTDKFFVKRYEEERNLTVHIIVDFSASMDFGTTRIKKWEYASMMGLGFAYMAMKNNERFVLSTFAEGLERFKPKRGKAQLAAMLDYLNSKKPKGHTSIENSLSNYKKLINTKSLIVIISDFLYDPEEIRNSLYRFKGHDIKLIQVLDAVERKLTLEGDFRLKDLETDQEIRTFIDPHTKKKYHEQLADHNALIQRICDELGVHFYQTGTDVPIFDSFYNILR